MVDNAGDVIVEVKPGEEVVSVNVGWTVERFVEEQKEKPELEKKKEPEKKPGEKETPKK